VQFRKRFFSVKAAINAAIKAAINTARVECHRETNVLKRNRQILVEFYFRNRISSSASSAAVKLMFI
jgi:hypothetical protein